MVRQASTNSAGCSKWMPLRVEGGSDQSWAHSGQVHLQRQLHKYPRIGPRWWAQVRWLGSPNLGLSSHWETRSLIITVVLFLSPLWPGAPPQWLSPSTCQSASHMLAVKRLFQDLLGNIKKAADLRGIAIPAEQPAPAHGFLSWDVYEQEPLAKRPSLWPRFTELQPFMEATFSYPRKQNTIVQIAAVQNNIALLSSAVSVMATKPRALSPDLVTDIGKVMTAILTLAMVTTAVSSRIMVWQTMMQRNIWLHMSQLLHLIRQELLDAAISPHELFGPLFQSTTAHLHEIAKEAKRVRKETFWVKAAPQPLQKCQVAHSKKKCPAAPAAAVPQHASAAAPPPPPPPQHPPPAAMAQQAPHRPVKNRQPACTLSNLP
eukprot:superscaffoldBa00002424_g14188